MIKSPEYHHMICIGKTKCTSQQVPIATRWTFSFTLRAKGPSIFLGDSARRVVFLRWREAIATATIRPPMGAILKRSELMKRNYDCSVFVFVFLFFQRNAGYKEKTMKLKLAVTALK